MELKDICQYVSEKVATTTLTKENYISTENMLPDKGGIVIASGVPFGNSTAFSVGDVLVSNIRPYFRKIWLANRNGGCSADVLCFRANSNVDNSYFYYLLSQQEFFDYIMSGAKGCKMPRGDKRQIMQWKVELPPLDEQRHIASVLSSLDSKIELNHRINRNLEQQAQALFKAWFVDFEPFKNGEFVDSELGKIPEGWKVGNLLDIAIVFDSLRKPLSSRERNAMAKIYPYYGATSLMDYVEDFIFDGTYLLMGEDGSVVNENGHPYLQYVFGRFWVNNHAHVLQGKNGYTTEMLHCLLYKKNISSIVTGAVQAKISQTNMKKILVVIPTKDICTNFSNLIAPIYTKVRNIEFENSKLSKIRDILLPRLMSGELNVNTITE